VTWPSRGRIVLLAAVAALIATAFLAGAGDLLTLDTLKRQGAAIAAWVDARPIPAAALYFLAYVASAALSIPGAAILTLAGGAIFGLVAGVILVSFASVIGAGLAFLGSRYLFRDWVRRRFGARLEAIDRGIEKDGALYLLALRLNPIFPFFLVNLAMGLTRMNLLKFAVVSQIGMLPATIVYVNAGTQIANVRSLRDIATPGLIGSLVLLSLLPLIGKAAAAALRRRNVYRGWKRPRRFDRNLIVIGAGAGGLVTSLVAAAVRARVTLIEEAQMGGDCLNRGCVPSKALIRSARAAHELRTASALGLAAREPEIDFPRLMARVNRIIAEIAPADSVERYEGLGVDVRQGRGRVIDPWTVEVNGERLTSRAIAIATGSEPIVPDLPGLAETGYLTSDTMWTHLSGLPDLPARLVVLGGGPIGIEMAQAFARLGSKVTVIQAAPRILTREDEEVSATIAGILRREGVELHCGHEATRCEPGRIFTRAGDETHEFAFDMLLVAVGRKARLAGFGLEALGFDPHRPVEVNGQLETRFPNLYLVGDAEGSYQFTHAAAHQGWHAAVNALFGTFRRFRVDYRFLPRVTFTEPEVAQVGLNEADARAAGVDHEIVRYPLSHHDRALTEEAPEGFVKFLVAPGRDRILGATIVGHNAGELIATAALAMKHGIGLNKLLGSVTAYPTMAEALKLAAGRWRQAHAPQRLLRIAERYHRWRRR
jgi:pyruvate/2-oxoglutarate dehydrogenase complex dihydrolipoamide dehydrogenase (E3) component/uncharacterized membrane protein YdjX (TVP38/TMEM64 family)